MLFTRTLSDRVVIVLRRSRGRGADEDHREEEEAREFERKKKSSSGHFSLDDVLFVGKSVKIFFERERGIFLARWIDDDNIVLRA